MMSPDTFRVDSNGLADDLAEWRAVNWTVEMIDGDPRKIPKRPAKPAGNAKSDDGSTWGSFDTTIENARENDDLGFGFPCGQPGHPFLFLDVDIPNGDEWVPSFDLLGGAIVERSPSGTSRRVILTGCEEPEWWTNQSEKTDADETREVKIFDDTGYVTLTGDTLDGFATPLEPTHSPALEKWLREAWLTFNDDGEPKPWENPTAEGGSTDTTPRNETPRTGPKYGEEWVDADTARNALNHIDPNLPNDEWVRIGFALGGHFPTGTAEQLFEQWSRGGSKWDTEAERRAPSIVRGADGTVGIGTLIHHAKQAGWDASNAAREATTASDGGTVASTPTPEDNGENSGATSIPSGLVEYGDEYATVRTDDNGEATYNQVTNFTMSVNSYVTMPDGSERINLTVHPCGDVDDYEVAVAPTVFNDKRTFRSVVVTSRATKFIGGERELGLLRDAVGFTDAPERQGTHHMGLHGSEFVLPAGVLTADGWTDDADTVYVERQTGFERKVIPAPEDTDPDHDREAIREIIETLPRTRDTERFLPVIGWFYAMPLAPQIREWRGEIPVLSITGNTGAGKTSTLETVWRLFGADGEPFSPADTTFTLLKTLSASNAVPAWYDEYKPSDMTDYQRDTFHDLIRKTTRGGVEQRGTADQGMNLYKLRPPTVVSGEQRFAGPAEQRRSVMTTFRTDGTALGTDTEQAFKRLSDVDLLGHAQMYYQWVLGVTPAVQREAWMKAGDRVQEVVATYGLTEIDSAGETALQTVAYGLGLYRAFASYVDADVPFDSDDVEVALRYVGKQHGDDGGRVNHLDQFIGLLSLAASDMELEEMKEYDHVRKGKQQEEIRVNLSRAYPKVSKYVRNHGLEDTELLGKADYNERIKEAAERGDSYVTCYQKNSPPVGRAFGIYADHAEAAIDEFSRDNFRGKKSDKYKTDEDAG